ncbi:MAG: glycine cleavage system aminomethyltransferase GcvT [Anaerolineae bacterium]|nr:glycine cleavage system aminomethyltransferase GcvT [Anaerolineae bacterium]
MTELKRTALFETHRRLGARMAPFAGWEMPLWYASTREEHRAVRTAAGLFDVAHMGVFEVSGTQATAFLDRVSTNDVSRLAVGRAQYSFLLNEAGEVIDDIMIYRLEPERYMMVVNAANAEKDWRWLQQQRDCAAHDVLLRDLQHPSSGEAQRVDLALQGPQALNILARLTDTLALLEGLPYAGVTHVRLADHEVIVARTGYTGERIAYELFVHPSRAVSLWDALLAAGRDLGLRPCGLAARDSLRIEAGLPLYGHELGGPLNLAPYHIGFDNFVKLEKAAAFIGRDAYAEKAAHNSLGMVRFRVNERSVRPPKLGDPVLDRRGRVVGTVTSCAADAEGVLIGLAVVEKSLTAEGTALYVLALPEPLPEPIKPFATLGSRALMPEAITVLTRFPMRPKPQSEPRQLS